MATSKFAFDWVYELTTEELRDELERRHLKITGSALILRNRLRCFEEYRARREEPPPTPATPAKIPVPVPRLRPRIC